MAGFTAGASRSLTSNSTIPASAPEASERISTTSSGRASSTPSCRNWPSSTARPATRPSSATPVPGRRNSTAKVRNIGDLVKQNTIADASIRQKADTAAGDLRNRVNKERAAAEAQLYSTENPDVASTYATNAIRNISAEQPDTSPLAEAFTLAGIGGANLFSGLQNAKRDQRNPARRSAVTARPEP